MITKEEIELRKSCDRFMSRGTTISFGDTVYGYYSAFGNYAYITSKDGTKIAVIPDKVDQCAGTLHNKVMVFENDIFKSIRDSELFIVERCSSSFVLNKLNGEYSGCVIGSKSFELVGSKSSNPEMMGL